jgi:hypothetical protein
MWQDWKYERCHAEHEMTEYYLIKRYMFFYIGLSVMIGIIIIGFFIYIFHDIPIIFLFYFFGLGIINIIFIFYKAIYEHIAVFENGVEYHSPWTILEINWNGVEKISYGWHNNLRIEGLLVDSSQIRIKKHSLFDRSIDPFTWRRMIIHVGCFAENWRESELGQQIKQYAPHLFQ